MTISKVKGDVDSSLLDAIQTVLQSISTKFVLGLEVGIRAFNMHIQGVVSLLMPKTDIYVRELKMTIKQVLPMRGRGFKIQIKPFSVGQTFSSMIGYCTKDQGRGHYQVRVHNVSPSVIIHIIYVSDVRIINSIMQELAAGRQSHDHYRAAFDDNKRVLPMKTLLAESWRYANRCLWPLFFPIHYTILYMVIKT